MADTIRTSIETQIVGKWSNSYKNRNKKNEFFSSNKSTVKLNVNFFIEKFGMSSVKTSNNFVFLDYSDIPFFSEIEFSFWQSVKYSFEKNYDTERYPNLLSFALGWGEKSIYSRKIFKGKIFEILKNIIYLYLADQDNPSILHFHSTSSHLKIRILEPFVEQQNR